MSFDLKLKKKEQEFLIKACDRTLKYFQIGIENNFIGLDLAKNKKKVEKLRNKIKNLKAS